MNISAYQHMNIRMSTRGKRPLRNLTPSDKVRAIQRIHNGETKASVSRDIGVPESTLRGWCKNEQKLRFMCRQLGADQVSSGHDNPPEKRLKYDGNSASMKYVGHGNMDELNYNRLPLTSMDLATNNAILEKMAYNEFIKKNSQSPTSSKQIIASSKLTGFNQSSLPVDYSQLAIMQNFNLLSLLNTHLPPISATAETNATEDTNQKFPLRTLNSTNDFQNSNSSSSSNNAFPSLSVKNWAKDVLDTSAMSDNKIAKRDINDSNNNDVKTKMNLSLPGMFPDNAMFPNLFSAGFPPIPSASEDSDTNNAALMDWCKVFNASLNFLALAAAAASLQQPTSTDGSNPNENHIGTSHLTSPVDNILYKQLTKNSRSPSTPDNLLPGSDLSNDSYFDSEPEDLSVRSNNSKRSSPSNSRSQSPTLMSSSSAHSDVE